MTEEMKTSVFVFVSEKITDKKLNGNNFSQWKRVVEIHITRKDHHLIQRRRLGGRMMYYSLDRSWTTWSHMFKIWFYIEGL